MYGNCGVKSRNSSPLQSKSATEYSELSVILLENRSLFSNKQKKEKAQLKMLEPPIISSLLCQRIESCPTQSSNSHLQMATVKLHRYDNPPPPPPRPLHLEHAVELRRQGRRNDPCRQRRHDEDLYIFKLF